MTEIFTIGSGIEIQGGRGRLISSNSNQDRILLQGSLETEEGGRIDQTGVDNVGAIDVAEVAQLVPGLAASLRNSDEVFQRDAFFAELDTMEVI